MEFDKLLEKTQAYVRQTLSRDTSGHDWWHIERVCRLARGLALSEGADPRVVELAALLHDIADWKFHGGDEKAGSRVAREWLTGQEVAPQLIDHVCTIIDELSYKGAGVATPMSTREGEVVQDADRLDALGAIGIARTFAYGGHRGRAIYDPDIPPELHSSFAAYKSSTAPTINHFYEKLLLLKDRLHTPTARRIAAERHRFMEDFLKQFFHEWSEEIQST